MHTTAQIAIRHKSFLLVISLVLVLILALSACGTNTSTGGSNSAAAPTSTPTATQSTANINSCPNNAVVTTPPPAATVILKNSNINTPVSVNKGDTIEVDLAFGHAWQGPTNMSQDLLSMQTPAGYASPTAKACVWRFVATSTGTAHLSFTGRPICKKGEACPMYIVAVQFIIDVK